jgi:hypothetical protein
MTDAQIRETLYEAHRSLLMVQIDDKDKLRVPHSRRLERLVGNLDDLRADVEQSIRNRGKNDR